MDETKLKLIIQNNIHKNRGCFSPTVFLKDWETEIRHISGKDFYESIALGQRFGYRILPEKLVKLAVDCLAEKQFGQAVDISSGLGSAAYYFAPYSESMTYVSNDPNEAKIAALFNTKLKWINSNFVNDFSLENPFDLITGVIPAGQRVEYRGKKITIEAAYISKAMKIVSPSGDIILIAPKWLIRGFIFERLRKDFGQYLQKVVSVNSDLMTEYGLNPAILHLRKKPTRGIEFYNVIHKEQLELPLDRLVVKVLNRDELEDSWEPRHYFMREKPLYKKLKDADTKNLDELATVFKGIYIPQEKLRKSGDYLYVKPRQILSGKIIPEKDALYINQDGIDLRKEKYILQAGDILLCMVGSEHGIYFYEKSDPPAIAAGSLAIIRSQHDDYIRSYLRSVEGQEVLKEQVFDLRVGTAAPVVYVSSLKKIMLPIIPNVSLNDFGDKHIETASKHDLEKGFALLQDYIAKLHAENKELKEYIADRSERIEGRLKLIEQKVDSILEEIRALSNDFNQIKNLPRETEEVIQRLYNKIDERLSDWKEKDRKTIDIYAKEISNWLDRWAILENDSKTFLPIAEFLFDELSKAQVADYSPFVIQYCRTLENEFYKKLFQLYHKVGLLNVDVKELVGDDANKEGTEKMAKAVLSNRPLQTFGDMHYVMRLIAENKPVGQESKLIQHFKEFTDKNFKNILSDYFFVKDIEEIKIKYRNKAAHKGLLALNEAIDCQKLLRKTLNSFLNRKFVSI